MNMLRTYCTRDSRFKDDTVLTILTCHIEQSQIKHADSEAISDNRTPDEVLLNDFNDGQEQSKTCPECHQTYHCNNNKT